MAKFKKDDTVIPKDFYKGLREFTIQDFDDKYYYGKIICGSAKLPIKALEDNYKLQK